MSSKSPAFECLSALSVILDLANGLDEDKSLVTATFALELSQEAGCGAEEQSAAFLASLVRHLGCTAYASVESTFATDDRALRSALIHSDASRPANVIAAVAGASDTLLDRSLGVLRLATQARAVRSEWTSEACGAARLLAEQLQLGSRVVQALDEVFERWDGAGAPRGLGGEAISVVGRVAQVAHIAVVFWLAGGGPLAREMLGARSGTLLDPRLTRLALGLLGRLEPDAGEYLAARAGAFEAISGTAPLRTPIENLAEAFGDFADLQLPFKRGHSRAVARVVEEAGAKLGLPAPERRDARLAAHLHDLGQVAVATSIWTRPRLLRPTELERARSHVYFTERILASAPPLVSVARIAGAHHERLDGSGYHRGQKQSAIPRTARLLAAADAMCGMQEERPHRPAKSREAAAMELRGMAKGGLLDPDCVDAVLATFGERRASSASPAPSLTARETDVLKLLAVGKTNKEIAQSLGISDRTVQHHTVHIYGKLGVNTRAAAALLAARYGVLDVASDLA